AVVGGIGNVDRVARRRRHGGQDLTAATSDARDRAGATFVYDPPPAGNPQGTPVDDPLRETPTAVREREHAAAAVAGMVERYRRRLRRDGYDWGAEIEGGAKLLMQFADRCDPSRWNEAFRAWKATGEVRDPVATVI